MSKTVKKILIAVLTAVLICAALWGGMTLLRNARRGEVNVYSVRDFMTDGSGWMMQTSGSVTADRLQHVYISDTQTVREIYVSEGQEVKKGDKLMAFDTTLGELDLQQAQIALDRQELQLKNDRAALEKLMTAKTTDELNAERAELEEKLLKARQDAGLADETAKPTLPVGDGSRERPICVEWIDGTELSQTALRDILGGMGSAYVLFVRLDGNAYTPYLGMYLSEKDGELGFTFVDDLSVPEQEKTETVESLEAQLTELDELIAMSYTRPELLKKQSEKRRSIADQEIALKIAQVDMRKLRSELEDGVVYCETDGVVKTVRDPNTAYMEGSAVIEVSGGGGYYIDCSLSELALDSVSVGQTVSVNSWMTGMSCEGTVAEISNCPTDNYGWSDGNPNVSYYPMRVFVSEDAELRTDDWVDVSYESSGDESAWYLENMFIRSENGQSFVFVRNEDGMLEQRTVKIGGSLWGSYTEIRGGLTQDDFVAFPYGKDVTDGAQTREATIDELYGW